MPGFLDDVNVNPFHGERLGTLIGPGGEELVAFAFIQTLNFVRRCSLECFDFHILVPALLDLPNGLIRLADGRGGEKAGIVLDLGLDGPGQDEPTKDDEGNLGPAHDANHDSGSFTRNNEAPRQATPAAFSEPWNEFAGNAAIFAISREKAQSRPPTLDAIRQLDE